MPTEIRPRRFGVTQAHAPVWLLLALLLAYIASFVMMLDGFAAATDAFLLAAP